MGAEVGLQQSWQCTQVLSLRRTRPPRREVFYNCRNGQKYYLDDGEELLTREVQHKLHNTEVIFVAAVARPRFDISRNFTFDGDISIFPFNEQRAVQHSSRNRTAGTMETKCVEVTKEVYKWKIADEVIPAIKA